MGKNARKHRDAHDEQVARYERLAHETLRELQPQLQRLDPPIVDSLPSADFSGRPENANRAAIDAAGEDVYLYVK